ncbi:MAG: S46 family peptidase [Bacteroidales bacterium]|nr:S46 family peptidase [Bacteroidales bacterium]
MFKKSLLLILISVFVFSAAKADEGMWLLQMIGKNYSQMKAQGFKLKPEDIYSVQKSSLKDAIVVFGGYCTGEIVSDKGLIFTNHHCGYQSIQQHSSVEHDYLKEGFWAKSFDEEIPTPGLYVSFLQEIRDVTDAVTEGVKESMSESERQEKIHENIEILSTQYEKEFPSERFYKIEIKPFFEGNAYYMTIYLVFNDVRMVGTPPDAIGKFGADTDNWMWPRHTCDFSVFRVYADKNGNPAEYSKDNVPFKPKHHLPVSLKGYKEGDFAMVMGFPGTTVRYSTSYEIANDMEENDYCSKIRGLRQDVLMADMEKDDAIRIKYATKFAHSSNYWKKFIEANKSLKALKIPELKADTEKKFENWFNADPKRQAQYKNVLPSIKQVCAEMKDDNRRLNYINECFWSGMELAEFAYTLLSGMMEDDTDALKTQIENFYKDYNESTDYKSTIAMIKVYKEDIEEEYWPEFLKISDDPKVVADYVFKTRIKNRDLLSELVNDTTEGAVMNDPAVKAMMDILNVYRTLYVRTKDFKNELSSARRLYVKGTNEMNVGQLVYPDANFTERLTFGTVQSYNPKDGVKMSYFTTTDGVLQKEIPGDYEFDVPKKLKDLILRKDFGRYLDKDGTMHACFLTNNDITGGNSGSPVIDGKGNLIGLAFDGNSESMSSDWVFNPELQRCINVDIRYVLFIIEKYGECKRIIDELTFAK